jgi:DNA invertase Pin-like site-specific DNA recombinase
MKKFRIGYARVSSAAQNLTSQTDILKQEGCEKIFTDQITGARKSRPGWDILVNTLRSGDIVVVTELSRMSRSLSHLLEIIKIFRSKEITLVSLRENIDTTTVAGEFFLSIMGAAYQMEMGLRAERAEAGRDAAKARGRSGGRPRIPVDKLERARLLYINSKERAESVCLREGFSKRSLFNYMAEIKRTKEQTR